MASKTESLSTTPVQPSGWQYAVRILLGCVIVWFVLQLIHHPNPLWALISVIIVTHFIRVPGSWRVAPVTVAILMTPSVLGGGRAAGLAVAIDRTEEVLLGSAAALLVTYVASILQRFIRRTVS